MTEPALHSPQLYIQPAKAGAFGHTALESSFGDADRYRTQDRSLITDDPCCYVRNSYTLICNVYSLVPPYILSLREVYISIHSCIPKYIVIYTCY